MPSFSTIHPFSVEPSGAHFSNLPCAARTALYLSYPDEGQPRESLVTGLDRSYSLAECRSIVASQLQSFGRRDYWGGSIGYEK